MLVGEDENIDDEELIQSTMTQEALHEASIRFNAGVTKIKPQHPQSVRLSGGKYSSTQNPGMVTVIPEPDVSPIKDDQRIVEAKMLLRSGKISNEEFRLRLKNAIPDSEWTYVGYGNAGKSDSGTVTVETVDPKEGETNTERGDKSGNKSSTSDADSSVGIISEIKVGDYILVDIGDHNRFPATVKSVTEGGDVLKVLYWNYPKELGKPFFETAAVKECDKTQVVKHLRSPVQIDKSRKRGPLTFDELKHLTEATRKK